jgi:hypothetical protein
MNLFIHQLDAIATTLEKANPASFNMTHWYWRVTERFNTENMNTVCGYVACVCGEQVVNGSLELFPDATATQATGIATICSIANAVSEDLYASCSKSYGYKAVGLALSVYNSNTRVRCLGLYKCGIYALLTRDVCMALQAHPHVTTASSAVLAADYIRLLIKSLTELEGTL